MARFISAPTSQVSCLKMKNIHSEQQQPLFFHSFPISATYYLLPSTTAIDCWHKSNYIASLLLSIGSLQEIALQNINSVMQHSPLSPCPSLVYLSLFPLSWFPSSSSSSFCAYFTFFLRLVLTSSPFGQSPQHWFFCVAAAILLIPTI